MKRVLAMAAMATCLLAAASTTLGTTYVRELSARQLGERAVAVVRGEVSGVSSHWNERRTKIFTEVLVQTRETYKGNPGGTVTILQLGGVVDNVRVTVHGALQWQPGEEVLLFLESSKENRYQVAGFSQGKLPIERDPDSGEAFVIGPAFDGPAPTSEPGKASPGDRAVRIPLSTFLREALGDHPEVER